MNTTSPAIFWMFGCQVIITCVFSHHQPRQGWHTKYLITFLTLTFTQSNLKDHIYRMVKERYSNIWPNQTIVSDQSELTIPLCQPMNCLLLMKTTLPWNSGLQLLPSYIYDPWVQCSFHAEFRNLPKPNLSDTTELEKETRLIDMQESKFSVRMAADRWEL